MAGLNGYNIYITGGEVKEEKSDLLISAVLYNTGRLITKMKVRVSAGGNLAERLISLNMEGEFFGFDIIDDFTSISKETRDFILLFKTYSFNVMERHPGEITIQMPVDTLFFRKLLENECVFELEKENFTLKSSEEYLPLNIGFDDTFENIILTGMENYYLFEGSFENYLIHKKRLYPVLFTLNREIMRELFQSGRVLAEYSLKKNILHPSAGENKLITRNFRLPEVRDALNAGIVFRYGRTSHGDFKISAYLCSENPVTEIPLDFNELRKSILLKEDIIFPAGKNVIVIARAGTEIYEKLKILTESLRNSFYELLNEFNSNEITTSDSDALFHKFLPSVLPFVELRDNKGPVNLITGGFDFKNAEISLPGPKGPLSGGWLEVNFKYLMQGNVFSLDELELIAKKGFIEKDSAIFAPDSVEIDGLRSLMEDLPAEEENGNIYTKPFGISFLLRRDLKLNIDPKLPGLSEFSLFSNQDKKVLKEVAIPDPPKGTLRSYQKTGVFWMDFLKRTGFSGILADEMGLGKTLQVLAFLVSVKGGGPSLIVCPSALLYNWVNEIQKFLEGGLTYIVIDGSKKERLLKIKNLRDYDVAITSYPLLHADSTEYGKESFFYCILDEAQHIKNKKAKRTLSIKEIKSSYRIALTGTPMENSAMELWSIFDFLMPGFLGTHQHFKKRFLDQMTAGPQQNIRALTELNNIVRPFMLRRTKNTVLKELPQKIEQEVLLELTDRQKAMYLETLAAVRKNYSRSRGYIGRESIDILAALTRLRQICLHPALIVPEFMGMQEISIKQKALIELLYESIDSGHRVAVFSQFVEMLKIVRTDLKNEEIEYTYLDGQTKNRFALVEHFNNSDIPVFLISLKAGGTGLNIVGADSVILLDPWWNPAVENQAIDRVHRIGQKKIVNVYRLLTRGTIEEKIRKLQSVKKEVFDSLISLNYSFISHMTWDNLRELLDIG